MTSETDDAPTEAVHDGLRAVEENWAAAIVSNDAERIAEFMDDDWVIVGESGVASKEQFLSIIQSGDLSHSAMDTLGEYRTRVYGDTAIVTGRVTSTHDYKGLHGDADEWVTDVYVKRNGRWLCVLTHLTPVVQA